MSSEHAPGRFDDLPLAILVDVPLYPPPCSSVSSRCALPCLSLAALATLTARAPGCIITVPLAMHMFSSCYLPPPPPTCLGPHPPYYRFPSLLLLLMAPMNYHYCTYDPGDGRHVFRMLYS